MSSIGDTTPNRAARRAQARRTRKLAALGSGAALATTGAAATVAVTATPAGAATFTVENLDASGAGSLDQAIQDANAAGGPDVIDFAPGLAGTIAQTSDLTDITDDVDIQGPGAGVITVDGGDASKLFKITGGAASSISGLTITNGLNGNGGGIEARAGDVTVTGVVVSSSTATSTGGGIYCYPSSHLDPPTSLTVVSSTVTGNQAFIGGGVFTDRCYLDASYSTFSGNTVGRARAGGLYIGGDALIRNSTIAGNRADGSAGGLYVDTEPGETVTVVNSTITGNDAGGTGGGVVVWQGEVSFIQSTISGNTAGGTTGGFYARKAGGTAVGSGAQTEEKAAKGDDVGALAENDVTIIGTIVAGNSGFDLTGVEPDKGVLSVDHSLLGSIEPSTVIDDLGGNLFDVEDPGLGDLADNGGPTQTMALLEGSPARDAGPDPVPDFPGNEFDQRGSGFLRVAFGRVDVGAYEVQEPKPVPIVIVPTFTG